MSNLQPPGAAWIARTARRWLSWSLVAAAVTTVWAATAEAKPTGLVLRVRGAVQLTSAGSKTAQRALDFVQCRKGDRYVLAGGAMLEVAYFSSGRRETWRGPARVTIGGAMSAGSNGEAGPRVRKLPAAAMRALKRLPLRTRAAGTARAGALRMRGLQRSGGLRMSGARSAGHAGQAKAAAANGPRRFDAAYNRQRAAEILADQRLGPLLLHNLLPAADVEQVSDGARALGFSISRKPAEGEPGELVLKAGAEGWWLIHVKGGPAWSVKARAFPALRKTLIDAARAARLTQLAKLRGASGLKLTLRLRLVSASAGKKRLSGTVRVGEKLVMEVTNKSDKKVHFALVEVGASPSFAVFHPPGALPAVLKPGRTFRLPSVFTAAPPVGPYMYYVVASTDASPWWRKSRSMWGDGAGLLLGQALHSQPPAAAIYWDRDVWTITSVPLVIRAAK